MFARDLLFVALAGCALAQDTFRFASAVGEEMVLQAAPQQAMVWGFVDSGAKVTVSFEGKDIAVTVGISRDIGNQTTWKALLPATPYSFKPYSLSATSGAVTIKLSKFFFGDVWLCSGQSNMAYPLGDIDCWDPSNENCLKDPTASQCNYGCVNNSEVEVPSMSNFADGIRLFQQPPELVADPDETLEGGGWLVPSNTTGTFSASCWFFGRDIFNKLASDPTTKRPIGLVEAARGGSSIELFSSPDAIKTCHREGTHSSSLYNGQIVPLLHTVIKGAIWYQGEANTHDDGRNYNCSFPTFIQDWREKWNEHTQGATRTDFYFGFAELNSFSDTDNNTKNYDNPVLPSDPAGDYNEWATGFASVRLAQATTLWIENTFMAVTLDTPVQSGAVHSPYKQPVGSRLARGGLALAYNMSELYLNPEVTNLEMMTDANGAKQMKATITGGTVVMHSGQNEGNGFEILGADNTWHNAKIATSDASSVSFGPVPPGAKAVRYLWYWTPCGLLPYQCPVYITTKPLGTLSGEEHAFYPLGPFLREL